MTVWYFISMKYGALVHGDGPAGWTMKLYGNGSLYGGRTQASWGWCDYLPSPAPDVQALSLRLRVTEADMSRGEWQAVRWEGTLTWNMRRIPSKGEPSCGGVSVTATVVGPRGF